MTRQSSPERREDEGRMWLFVVALVLPLLAVCAAGWVFAETPTAKLFVEMVR